MPDRGDSALRETIGGYLRTSFPEVSVDSDDDFVVSRGDATVWVRVRPPDPGMEEGRLAMVWSIPNVDVNVDEELTHYLATEAGSLDFAQFELNERGLPTVHISYGGLAEFLSREELRIIVEAVLDGVDRHGPVIQERFGGRRWNEAPSIDALHQLLEALSDDSTGTDATNTNPNFSDAPEPITADDERRYSRFGAAGFFVGLAAGVVAFLLSGSWALPIFVWIITAQFVARGLGDLVTDDHKLARAAFFSLPPVVATGVLALTYSLWGRWWLAVLAGIVVGIPASALLGARLFPRIAREEAADDQRRLTRLRQRRQED